MTGRHLTQTAPVAVGDDGRRIRGASSTASFASASLRTAALRRVLFATTAIVAVTITPVAGSLAFLAAAGWTGGALAEGGRGGDAGSGNAGGAGGVRSGSASSAGANGSSDGASGGGGGGGSAGATVGAGGTGGNATNIGAGDGGNGGSGGTAGGVVATGGTLASSNGGNGGNGTDGGFANGGGGGGGEGGIGTLLTGTATINDIANGITLAGGDGGGGGDGDTNGGGGGGGDGGIGLLSTGNGFGLTTVVGSTITAGDGGDGGASSAIAGAGGRGGAGIVLLGSGGTLDLAGTVTGGDGGDGPNTIGGTDGPGGNGGAGILATGGATINLSDGTIRGGDGGDGGGGATDGSAGAGIEGQNLAVSIAGGVRVEAGTGADGASLRFTGGANTLSIASATSNARLGGGIDNAGGTLTLSQATNIVFDTAIRGSGSVVKTGVGTLSLSTANSYTGTTTVNAGTLALGTGNALSDATSVTVNGGTFDIGGNSDTVAGVTLIAGSITGTTGTLTSTSDFDVRSGTVSARLGGNVGLNKTTAGDVTLSGNNSYNGTTDVSAGRLIMGAANAIGDGSDVRVTGGEFAVGAFDDTVEDVTLLGGTISGTTGTLTSTAGYDVQAGSVSARLGGTGILVKSGSGTVTLSGNNSYTGDTIVNSGELALGAAGVVSDDSTIVVAGGNFNIGGNDETVGDVLLLSGVISGTTGTLTSRDRVEAQSGILDANLDIENGDLFVKTTTGTVILSGVNVYTGSTQVDEGTLELQGGAAIIDTGLVDVADGTTLRVSTNEVIGALSGAPGGTVDLGATLTTGGSGDTTFSGNAVGSGNLVKDGGSAFTLAGNNSFAGPLLVNGGTLVLTGSLVSGIANGANLVIATSGRTDASVTNLSGANASNAGVIDSGLVNAGAFTQTGGAVNGGTTSTGVINANGGAFNGQVSNAGLFTVGGGATVTGDSAFVNTATATLAVSGGATYNVSGVITNDGIVSVASGGTLATNASLLNQGAGSITNAGRIEGTVDVAAGTLTSTGVLDGDVLGRGTAALQVSGQVLGDVSLSDSATMAVSAGDASGITRLDNSSAAAAGVTVASGRRLSVGELTSASGGGVTQIDGTLDVGVGGAGSTYAGRLTGGGTLNKQGAGTTVLANAATTQSFTGVANVQGGTLAVNGVFGDTAGNAATVNVQSGGTLGGSGTIAGSVNILDGGTLAPGTSPGTLTVTNLSLAAGSSINYELGSPNNPSSALNDRTVVTGNLTLDGTLNVVGPAATGYYRIFDVNTSGTGTAFTDNGLAVGLVPAGASGRISVIAPVLGGATPTRGEVNLQLVNGNQQLQLWDGGTGGLGDGTAAGGSGVWNSANANWTNDPNALFNDSWQGDVGVFRGAAGTVTVDGTQRFEGLQFSTDGYVLQGGTLEMTGDAAGGTADRSFLNVDAGVSATISSTLSGVGLNKIGNGTLVLAGAGANTYSGVTTLNQGTIRIAKDGALGATGFANRTTLAGGTTLDYVAGVSSAETIELAGSATLLQDDGAATAAVQSGALVGAGQLTKTGDGILVLQGSDANTYTGATVLSGGTLRLGKNSALGATGAGNGTLAAAGTTLDYVAGVSIAEAVTLNGAVTLLQDDGAASSATQSGQIDGGGSLIKQGNGILVLSGANLYTGATTIAGGTLSLAGTGSVAASSVVDVAAGAAFDIAGTTSGATIATLSGAGTVALGDGRLGIAAGSTTFTGVIGGLGGVDVAGGRQVLAGANTYSGGTRLNGGTLVLGSNAALGAVNGVFATSGLGSGALLATSGTVEYADAVTIANEVVLNGAITVDQVAGTATQQGTVSGNGSIRKTGAGRLDFSALGGTLSAIATDAGTLVASNVGTLGNGGIVIDARGGTTEITNASGGRVSGAFASSAGATLRLTNAVGGTVTLDNGSTSVLSGADTIVNAGTMEFAGATTLSGVESFINSGTLSTSGGRLTYSGGTDFVNAGTIDLQNDALGDSLVIDGTFTANAGSSLLVDVDFGGDNAGGALLSDQLLVSGEGRGGTTSVNFNNVADGAVLGLQPNPIVVARFGSVAGGSDLVAANLPNDGLIRYRFGRDGAGDYVISSALNSDAVGGLAANFSSSQALISASLSRPTNSFVSAPVQPEPDQYGYAPWFRAIGGNVGNSTLSNVTNPSMVSETQQTDIDIDYAGGQFGFDVGRFNIGGNGGNVNVGVTGGFNSGTATQGGFSNDTEFDTRFVGLYAAYTNGSFFGDAQVRYDVTDFEIMAPSVSDTTLEADTKRYSFNVSTGYTFEVMEGTSFVPSVGLTYAFVETSNIATDFGDLSFEDTQNIIGFASTTLARTFVLPGETQALTPFVTGTIYSDFGDDTVSTFSDVNGLDAQIVTENIGTYGEIGVGMNYRRLLDENRFGVKEMIGAVRADFTVGDTTEGAGVTGQFRLQF